MTPIDEIKLICRERDMPFFTDEELEYYLSESKGDVKLAAYTCLIVKSERSEMALPGLTLPDTSSYFRRQAARYKPSNSGQLKRR